MEPCPGKTKDGKPCPWHAGHSGDCDPAPRHGPKIGGPLRPRLVKKRVRKDTDDDD